MRVYLKNCKFVDIRQKKIHIFLVRVEINAIQYEKLTGLIAESSKRRYTLTFKKLDYSGAFNSLDYGDLVDVELYGRYRNGMFKYE